MGKDPQPGVEESLFNDGAMQDGIDRQPGQWNRIRTWRAVTSQAMTKALSECR